jgi:hypothetical protein
VSCHQRRPGSGGRRSSVLCNAAASVGGGLSTSHSHWLNHAERWFAPAPDGATSGDQNRESLCFNVSIAGHPWST